MSPASLPMPLDPAYIGATFSLIVRLYDGDESTPLDMTGRTFSVSLYRKGLPSAQIDLEAVEDPEAPGVMAFTVDAEDTSDWRKGSYAAEFRLSDVDAIRTVLTGVLPILKGAAEAGQDTQGARQDGDGIGVIIAAAGVTTVVFSPSGLNGKSAYRVAVENGYEGTEEEYAAAPIEAAALANTKAGLADVATEAANTATAAANAAAAIANAAGGPVNSTDHASPQAALDFAYAANRPLVLRSSTDVAINLAINSGQTATERMAAFNALATYLQTCVTAGAGKIWMVVPVGFWLMDGAALVQTSQHNKIFLRTTASPSQLDISSLTWTATATPGLWTLTVGTTAALPAIVVPQFPVGIHNPVADDGDAELATGSHIVETVAVDRLSFTCKVQIPLTDASGERIVPVNSTVMDYAGIDNGIPRSLLSVPRAAFGVLGGFDGAVVEGWVNARGGVGEQKWLGVSWLGANGDGCLYLAQDANSYWFFGDYDVICGGPERTFRGYDNAHFRFNRTAMGVGPSATGQVGLLQSGASANMTRSSWASSLNRGWEVTDHAAITIQQSYGTGGTAGVQTADGGQAEIKTSKISYSIRGANASQGGTISYDTATRLKNNLRSMDVLAGGYHIRTPILEGNAIDMPPDEWVNGGAWISSTSRGIRSRSPVTKTSGYTAIEGDDILADTSGGTFAINLPATHVAGDRVRVTDALRTWGTNPLTITPLGAATIIGTAGSFVASTSGATHEFLGNGVDWIRR